MSSFKMTFEKSISENKPFVHSFASHNIQNILNYIFPLIFVYQNLFLIEIVVRQYMPGNNIACQAIFNMSEREFTFTFVYNTYIPIIFFCAVSTILLPPLVCTKFSGSLPTQPQ